MWLLLFHMLRFYALQDKSSVQISISKQGPNKQINQAWRRHFTLAGLDSKEKILMDSRVAVIHPPTPSASWAGLQYPGHFVLGWKKKQTHFSASKGNRWFGIAISVLYCLEPWSNERTPLTLNGSAVWTSNLPVPLQERQFRPLLMALSAYRSWVLNVLDI